MMNSGGACGDMGKTYGLESGTSPLVADPGSIRDIAAVISDEEFLSQLEIAIDGPTAAALQPLDELTPRAWEVR